MIASAAMYGTTVYSHNAYFKSTTSEEAGQLRLINNISHTTALSFSVLSATTFVVGKIVTKKETE